MLGTLRTENKEGNEVSRNVRVSVDPRVHTVTVNCVSPCLVNAAIEESGHSQPLLVHHLLHKLKPRCFPVVLTASCHSPYRNALSGSSVPKTTSASQRARITFHMMHSPILIVLQLIREWNSKAVTRRGPVAPFISLLLCSLHRGAAPPGTPW